MPLPGALHGPLLGAFWKPSEVLGGSTAKSVWSQSRRQTPGPSRAPAQTRAESTGEGRPRWYLGG